MLRSLPSLDTVIRRSSFTWIGSDATGLKQMHSRMRSDNDVIMLVFVVVLIVASLTGIAVLINWVLL